MTAAWVRGARGVGPVAKSAEAAAGGERLNGLCCGCHHGWVMLLAISLITAASSMGHSFSLAPFVDGWMQELQISRHTFSGMWTVTMLVSSLASPIEGQLIDTYGSRRVLLACVPLSIACLVWVGLASTPVELAVAITVNRLINADTYPLLGTTALSHWFVKRRGRASVVLGLVWAWILAFPGVELKLNEHLGTTGTYSAIAAYAGALALVAGVGWRDTPESVGLLPDLAWPAAQDDDRPDKMEKAPLDVKLPGAASASEAASRAIEVSFTRAQASRTLIFWAIVLMQLMQNTLWQAIHLHLLDVLSLKGLDGSSAKDFYLHIAVSRTLVSLLFSFWLVDSLGRYCYMLLVLGAVPMLVVTLLLLGYLGPGTWHPVMASLLGLVYGVWGGINSSAGTVVFAQLYGRKHIGAISGLALGASRISGAIGPLLFGITRDVTGSYELALQVLTLGTVLVCAMLVMAPLPALPAERASGVEVGVPGVAIGSPTQLADVVKHAAGAKDVKLADQVVNPSREE